MRSFRPYFSLSKCFLALAGSAILAFGLYNVHSFSNVTEGGVLGMTLLLHHWFGLSPSISGLVLNAACYIGGWRTLGRSFIFYSVIGYAALMCCLALFPTFEIDLKNRSNHFEVHLELKNREDLQRFITTMRTLGLKIDDIEANPAYINSGLSVYSVSLTVRQKDRAKYSSHQEMIEAINTLDFVYYAEEID